MGITATPQNAALDYLSRALRSARDTGDKVDLPILGGLGSLLLGKSPEEVAEWSYGNAPMQMTPQGDRLPKMKAGRGAQVADTLFAGADIGGLGKLAAKPAGKLAAEAVARGMESGHPLLAGAAPSYVVKPKGGNWLTGSVEEALAGLRPFGNTDELAASMGLDRAGFLALPKEQRAAAAREALGPDKMAMDSWITGPLTKYVKTRMASPEDEVRRLAEEGVLHFEPRGIRDRAPIMDNVVARRLMSGNPATERAVTPLGEQWERYADAAIEPKAVSELSAGQIGKNLWAEKLPRDTTVYGVDNWRMGSNAEENLGFNHLINNMLRASDPASDLPHHLRLPPEAVQNMSMEKAVRRSHAIDQFMSEQKVAANRALAEQASVLREYTDPAMPNPKGLRWVELKEPESRHTTKGHPLSEDAAYKQLQEQLKYEGDTMGHCVGGYCDDVLSGRTRIMSLRDAKGEPHVTVEVEPTQFDSRTWTMMTPEQRAKVLEVAGEDAGNTKLGEATKHLFPEVEWFPSRIKQIKGKGNKAPNEEYLPFVQDFVRNNPLGGQWADVGDLQNTGLWKNPRTGAFHTKAEAEADEALQAAYESRNLGPNGEFLGNRFAQGGPVNSAPPAPEQAIMSPKAPSWAAFFANKAV